MSDRIDGTPGDPALEEPPDEASRARAPAGDDGLSELRSILLDQERQQLGDVSFDVDELKALLADQDALAAMIAPSLDDALRRKIEQNRDEMIEVLYPIIGQTVVRAVAESVQDLARNVDARVRTSLTPASAWRRIQASFSGVSGAELALRDALPFKVIELFLIHRETGLLLRHLTAEGESWPDTDLIGGMLTAIRDFAGEAFGRGQEGQLDAIQYGDRRILIEAAEHIYLAVVVEGVEPVGFRNHMRETVFDVENRFRYEFRDFDGDFSAFGAVDPMLSDLLVDNEVGKEPPLSRTQRRILWGLVATMLACSLLACLGGAWLVKALDSRWLQPVAVVLPSATLTKQPTATVAASATPTPTETSTMTPSSTPSPTSSPTATPSPTLTPMPATLAPLVTPQRGGSVDGVRLNVRAGPGLEFPVRVVAAPGETYQLLGRSEDGQWWQICCMEDGSPAWVFAQYILAPEATPTPAP
ncbi:MAG: SH3 domain-containing protein [Chloroflexota bacterium]|nr:SH3 domain-containing protein [Chloroflexota bacterium]